MLKEAGENNTYSILHMLSRNNYVQDTIVLLHSKFILVGPYVFHY